MNFGFMRMNLNILTKRNGMKFISLFHCCNLQIHPHMGVVAFTGSNKVKRPVGSTETWAQEFWPNGPTVFLCF